MRHVFIHSSVDGYLGSFQVLAGANNAAVSTRMHEFFGIKVFSGYMPRNGVASFLKTILLR